jgi:hypothetical protein
MPPFTSETAWRARQRKAGLAAARYWKARGFANVERARQQRSLNAWQRREEKRQQPPLVVNLKCPCGRVHRVEDASKLTENELRIVAGLARSRGR